MDWIITFFTLVVGLSVGSFLNVVIFRLDKKGGILLGRSECPHCNRALRWHDLIPVLSFLTLKGKCRYCRRKISRTYPAVEILTALAFLAYIHFQNTYDIRVIYELALISGLIVILFSDLLELIIPDKIVFPLIALAFTFKLQVGNLQANLITAFIVGSIFAIICLGSQGKWMGLGDAKLVFLIGLVLGYPLGVLAILLSVWTAALVGMALVSTKRATLKTALPLGTFLASSAILIIIFQNELQKITQTIF